MKKYLNLPILILLAFIIRLLVTGASFGEALVIVALSALVSVRMYFDYKTEPEANQALKERLIEVEEQVKVTKETVHSLKLGSSLKR